MNKVQIIARLTELELIEFTAELSESQKQEQKNLHQRLTQLRHLAWMG